MLGRRRCGLQPEQGEQQVERTVTAGRLLRRQQPRADFERVQQDDVDVLREVEADHEADRERRGADDQPLAQLDQMLHQRRARRLDVSFLVQVAQVADALRSGSLGSAGSVVGAAAGGAGAGLGAAAGRVHRRMRRDRRLGRVDVRSGVGEVGADLGDHVARAEMGGGEVHRPGGAHRLHLAPQFVELGLARQLVERGAELGRHAAHLGHELAHLAHQQRQVLRADDDQGDGADDQEIEQPAFGEHRAGSEPWLSGAGRPAASQGWRALGSL